MASGIVNAVANHEISGARPAPQLSTQKGEIWPAVEADERWRTRRGVTRPVLEQLGE